MEDIGTDSQPMGDVFVREVSDDALEAAAKKTWVGSGTDADSGWNCGDTILSVCG